MVHKFEAPPKLVRKHIWRWGRRACPGCFWYFCQRTKVQIKRPFFVSLKKETEINAIMAMKEVYETRIAEIKESSAERTQSLQKDKKFLTVVCCILGITLILFVLIDFLIGTVGWIRY